MNTSLTTPFAPSSGIRHLDDDEIDEVNGAWLFAAVVLVNCFSAGLLVGSLAADYQASRGVLHGQLHR